MGHKLLASSKSRRINKRNLARRLTRRHFWVFKDTTMTLEGELTYSYSFVTGASSAQCPQDSYDAVYNSDQLVLIESHPGKHNVCYIVDMLTESRLVLFNELNGRYLSFEKQDNQNPGR